MLLQLDLTSNFTIIDTDDQIRLIKNICKAENIDIKQLHQDIFYQLLIDGKIKAFIQVK